MDDDTQMAEMPVDREEDARAAPPVFEVLRRRIITHELSPGAPLREQALASEFGVSRARVREAFAALEQRGLVERTANRGATVRRASVAEMLQAFDVREMLEGLAARLATRNAAPESWQPLVDLFGEPTVAALERGDIGEYLRNHDLLRQRILAAADNAALLDALRPLYDRTVVVMRRLVLTTNHAHQALQQHQAMLAAMRQGDAEAAEALRRAQMRAVRASLERYHNFLL